MHYAEIALADGVLFDTESEPKCEYRSPQYDNGAGESKWVKCNKPATSWGPNGGLRCIEHERD